MTRALALLLLACVPAPVVQAPVVVQVMPAAAQAPCVEPERVLVDDQIEHLADAGEEQ